jgi:RHS repeat-associated protein
VHALTDNNGSILEGYLYDAYGRHTVFTPGAGGSVEFGDSDAVETGAPSALGNIWLFTGRQFDAESGLLFYRSRYLNPSLGRFISRDPHDPWSNLKNLGNGYPYAVNSAVNWVDPFGLEASDWTYNAGEPFIDSFGNQCQTAYWSRETVVEGNPTIEIQEIGTTCQSSGGFGGRISRPHLMSPTPPIRGGPGPKPNKPTPPQPPTEASQKVPECFKEASREHQNCRAKCAMTAMKDTTGTGVDVGSHAMAGGGIGYAIGKWGLPAAATLLAPELLPVAVKWGGRIGMVVGGGVGAVVGWITADTPGDCRDECFLTLQLAWVGCYAKNS